ncbi:MAG: L,D-transpeptidase family protein [Eubacterium sp.]|nr:L,D-transpeptidase family protein [Eubacterium sp.]
MVMLLECASAGLVWADAEGDEESSTEVQSEIQVQGEAVSDEAIEDSPEMPPDPAAPSDEQDDPAEGSEDQEKPEEPADPDILNGWVDTEAGRMYYIDGTAQTDMQEIDGSTYFFDESGIMQTGMVDINGSKYCFGDDGVMKTGMTEYEGAWYYFSSKGVMKTGWKTISKKKYYFDPETGQRQHGKQTISGAVYYFKENGVMKTGWLKVDGKKYYHNPKNGKRVFGSKKIGKYYYYFVPKSGRMKTGWLKLKGKRYYYNSKGHKRFGQIKVNGKTYYLDLKTGARVSKGNYYLYKPIWKKSSRTRYLIYVDKKNRYVTVYKGKRKNWTVVRRCRCSIGKKSTPTPSGTYHMTSKVLHFGEGKGYTVWYASGFIGTLYLMHSVVCYRGTKRVSDGRLGKAISHGCVRMSLGNANWIYKHIPRGTTVYIK